MLFLLDVAIVANVTTPTNIQDEIIFEGVVETNGNLKILLSLNLL